MQKLILDRTSRRIIGVLIEKEMTTPEYYPMTVNALRDGCNQKNNRDPVMNLQDFEVDGALRSLFMEQWVTNITQPGGRALKWRHRAEEKLALDKREKSIIAELLLRGAQQPGELRTRVTRFVAFQSLEDLEDVLTQLISKGLVANLGRRSGERAPRYDHRLYAADEATDDALPLVSEVAPAAVAAREPQRQVLAPVAANVQSVTSVGSNAALGDVVVRLQSLERQVRDLSERVEQLEQGKNGD